MEHTILSIKTDKDILSELSIGNIVHTIVSGNSMNPLLKEGEVYSISPIGDNKVKLNDIVFVQIKNKFLTHMIFNIITSSDQPSKYVISNIHGKIDGIVYIESIYGIINNR